MKIVERSAEIISVTKNPEKHIELCGGTCYKSEDNITEESSKNFINKLISMGHESVLEHAYATFRVICDRSTSHQWVRHRIASYSQESQRYCNYGKDKFEGVSFIIPYDLKDIYNFKCYLLMAEKEYLRMIDNGTPPEIARSILPNCTKTEIVCTNNFRSWRNLLKERLSSGAQADIRILAENVLEQLFIEAPTVFGDIRRKYYER